MPAPMPWLPPVTRATRPARSRERVTRVEYQASAWLSAERNGMGYRFGARRRRRPRRHDGLPAGERPAGAGMVRPRRRARRGRAATWTPTSSYSAPRARASTPAWTSRRCRHTEGFDALIGANRGCFAAFRAVYECAVPVIAAVQGFCLGGGVGLVGNADCIVASDDAFFGIPEVDRGALGAATHLVPDGPAAPDAHALLHRPQHRRHRPRPARLGARGGSPRTTSTRQRSASPREIARKDTRVIRMAKEAINGIDPIDVNRAIGSSRASRWSSTSPGWPTSTGTRS